MKSIQDVIITAGLLASVWVVWKLLWMFTFAVLGIGQ